METSKSTNFQDSDRVKEGIIKETPLYNSAVTAIQAGLAATAQKYNEMDNDKAKKNPVRGTIPYDNDKSVFYA